MRTMKILFLMLSVQLLLPRLILAQDNNKSQAYWIHEDQVKPSMVTEYEKTTKNLVAKCKEHNLQGLDWITTVTEEYKYLYVTPIDSMADINYAAFDVLSKKMGKEALSELFSDMDKCYDKHGDYIIRLDKELSYMPEGITQTPEGMPYRKFTYYHYTPENYDEVFEKAAAIKAVFESKNATMHYRVYKSGFGTMGSYFLVAVAAKSAEDYERLSKENRKILGEEFGKLLGELHKKVSKIERESGAMRPDLDYIPE
ncbi:hypothetical protein [uncultured Maribacter sp.]|uniref:hypothetical protein n=1 Tax=uncultured Maribacter sp. TaxID=431308 RepID=UPI00262590BB|nr:hypothetical protein [uncultured Maribacter sp.]